MTVPWKELTLVNHLPSSVVRDKQKTHHLVNLVGEIDVGALEFVKHILDALTGAL